MREHKSEQKSDHEIDMEFGQWLRDRRTGCGLTLEQASTRAGIAADRLKSLELGYAEKGITANESNKLCAAYKISLDEMLDRASGKNPEPEKIRFNNSRYE